MAVTLRKKPHGLFGVVQNQGGGNFGRSKTVSVFFFGLEVCVEGELVVLATRHDAGLLVVSDPGERKLKRGKLDLNRPRS